MLILKDLFNGIYDGIIAPQMFSPFHTYDNIHEEIIIFKPSLVLETMSDIEPKLVETHEIENLFNSQSSIRACELKYKTNFKRAMYGQCTKVGDCLNRIVICFMKIKRM